MLTVTVLVNGKRQILSLYRVDAIQMIAKTFLASDYMGETYSCAKYGANPSNGTFVEMSEI